MDCWGGAQCSRKTSQEEGEVSWPEKSQRLEADLAFTNKGCERTHALRVLLPAKRTADAEQAQEQGSRGEARAELRQRGRWRAGEAVAVLRCSGPVHVEGPAGSLALGGKVRGGIERIWLDPAAVA